MGADGAAAARDPRAQRGGLERRPNALNGARPLFIPMTQLDGAAAARGQGFAVDPAVPLFVFMGRLDAQKGVDVLFQAVEKVLDGGLAAQFVFMGSGIEELEEVASDLEARFPAAFKAVLSFKGQEKYKTYAAGDFALMPSRYEPCGLVQVGPTAPARRRPAVRKAECTGGGGVCGYGCGRERPQCGLQWQGSIGSGPRYMICATLFHVLHVARVRKHTAMRESHAKRATKSDTSGHCLGLKQKRCARAPIRMLSGALSNRWPRLTRAAGRLRACL